MQNEDQHESGRNSLIKAIQSLPVLGDEPYLFMQVMNLGIVDDFLTDLERDFFRKYTETDSTPLPDALLVSALSQMWVFAVYEILRTWRQRCREVLKFGRQLSELKGSARETRIAEKRRELQANSPYGNDIAVPLWRAFERTANDSTFVIQVRKALDSSEGLFRKIEALRVHLAKHEMPKAKGSFGMAPGYARIDGLTGSLSWQILLRGNEVDIISRREIADLCRKLVEDRSEYFLPPEVQDKIEKIPESSYGAKTVTLKLSDGTEYHRVIVLWNKEVAAVLGREDIPFSADKVVDAFEEPGSEAVYED